MVKLKKSTFFRLSSFSDFWINPVACTPLCIYIFIGVLINVLVLLTSSLSKSCGVFFKLTLGLRGHALRALFSTVTGNAYRGIFMHQMVTIRLVLQSNWFMTSLSS